MTELIPSYVFSDPPNLIEGLEIGFPLSFADGGTHSRSTVMYCYSITANIHHFPPRRLRITRHQPGRNSRTRHYEPFEHSQASFTRQVGNGHCPTLVLPSSRPQRCLRAAANIHGPANCTARAALDTTQRTIQGRVEPGDEETRD